MIHRSKSFNEISLKKGFTMVTETLKSVDELIRKGRGDLAIKLLQDILTQKDLTSDQRTRVLSKLGEALLLFGLSKEGEEILKPLIFSKQTYHNIEKKVYFLEAIHELIDLWFYLMDIENLEKYKEFLIEFSKKNDSEIIKGLQFEIEAILNNLKGKFNKALNNYLRAKTIFEKHSLNYIAACILEKASRIDILTNQNSIAYELIEEVFSLLPEDVALFRRSRFLSTKALIEIKNGKQKEACSDLKQAFYYISRGFGNSQSYVDVYCVAAEYALVRGKAYQAQVYLELALGEIQGIKSIIQHIYLLNLQLAVYYELRKLEESLELFFKHEKYLSQIIAYPFFVTQIIVYTSLAAVELGKFEVLEQIKQSIENKIFKDSFSSFIEPLISAMEAYSKNNWQVAEKNLLQVIQMVNDFRMFNLKLVAYYYLGQLYLKMALHNNDYKKAENALRVAENMEEIVNLTGYSQYRLKGLLIKALALVVLERQEEASLIFESLGSEIENSELVTDIQLYHEYIALAREEESKEYTEEDTYFFIIKNLIETGASDEELIEVITSTIPDEIVEHIKERVLKEFPEAKKFFE